MKNVFVKTTIVASVLLTVLSVNAQDYKKQRPSVDNIFEKMDADKDGKISAIEVEGPLKEKFKVIDANSDGFITKEEMKNAPKPQKHKAH